MAVCVHVGVCVCVCVCVRVCVCVCLSVCVCGLILRISRITVAICCMDGLVDGGKEGGRMENIPQEKTNYRTEGPWATTHTHRHTQTHTDTQTHTHTHTVSVSSRPADRHSLVITHMR